MNVLDNAINSRLKTTSAITSLISTVPNGTAPAIYHLQAPEGQAYPYVVFNVQGGGDVNDTANRLKNLMVFIRVYTAGLNGAAQGGSIDARIDTALHLVPLTVTGWSNIWRARETDVELVQNEPGGQQIHTNGGVYRMILNKT